MNRDTALLAVLAVGTVVWAVKASITDPRSGILILAVILVTAELTTRFQRYQSQAS